MKSDRIIILIGHLEMSVLGKGGGEDKAGKTDKLEKEGGKRR